ncbi:GTPase activating protein [Tieghemiomyces parasiticus]|uniref:GTPase activating protein n=1 Tax=Tieghemiomyces parasiticus TaxID=78921 RepID=A0A9W8AH08_9FUNG|nr:GTPase activating protein [Tieghemiomyces parasiticus]
MDPLNDAVKELSWTVLERLSRVTRFYRESTAHLLEHPLGRPLVPLLPPALVSHVQVPRGAQEVCDDYESARVYLAKWASSHFARAEAERPDHAQHQPMSPGPDGGSPLQASVWQEWLAEQTECGEFEILTSSAAPPLVRSNQPLSAERWVGFFALDTPTTDGTRRSDDTNFRPGQLTVTADEVRRAVFAGGVDPDIRPEVWKFLLGLYPWGSDEAGRYILRTRLTNEYYDIKARWLNRPAEHETAEFKEQCSRIEKDVLRTDRTVSLFAASDSPAPPRAAGDRDGGDSPPATDEDTASSETSGLPGTNANLEIMKDILMSYHYHNRDLGYVQGMSDLLAPIYAVMQDEVETFWCFVAFMDRMEPNFRRDQAGMHKQLQTLCDLTQFMLPRFYQFLVDHDADNMFCAFRWLLIWFKREFAFADILVLWEVLWSDHLTPHFYYFVALAILDQHADVIAENLVAFDEILKYINDLSGTIDLSATLRRAEILYHRFGQQMDFFDRHAQPSRPAEGKEGTGTAPAASNGTALPPSIPATLRALRPVRMPSAARSTLSSVAQSTTE